MRIQKKRVLKVKVNLVGVAQGSTVITGYPVDETNGKRLQQIGFTPEAMVGERVLPSVLGPATRYNAEGKAIVHRDKPMETKYREMEWTYNQWHGKDSVEVTDFVDVPYKCYPRTPVPPVGIELMIVEDTKGRKLIVAPSIRYVEALEESLRVAINVLLELFGACDILDESLSTATNSPFVSLNWTVLPQGEMPWPKLKPLLQDLVDRQKPGNKPVVAHRLEEINKYSPDFVAVGQGGFSGYVVFGFPKKNLFVLECTKYGNATYVFERDWEALSQMTKAEILNNAYQKDRLIHVEKWVDRLRDLLQQ